MIVAVRPWRSEGGRRCRTHSGGEGIDGEQDIKWRTGSQDVYHTKQKRETRDSSRRTPIEKQLLGWLLNRAVSDVRWSDLNKLVDLLMTLNRSSFSFVESWSDLGHINALQVFLSHPPCQVVEGGEAG